MSNEIKKEDLISDILNGMSNILDNEQLKNLKNILYIKLNNVQITKNTYDIAVLDDDNDIVKLERFMISNKIKELSDKSINQYVISAKNLRKAVNKNFADITSDDIECYIARKQIDGKWSDRTSANQYANMNVFFSYLEDKGYIKRNPMKDIERIKISRKLPKPYSIPEMEKIRNACKGDIMKTAMVEFFLATALRVESIHKLKWEDLDMNKKTGIIVVKGGDEHKFRFNDRTVFYLNQYLDYRMKKEDRTYDEIMERPLFVRARKDTNTGDYEALSCDGIRYIMNKIKKDTGIQQLHPHRFRRTFACNAIAHGMPMEDVKEHLGHKDIKTTFIYAEITDMKLEHSYRTYCE